MTRIRGSSPEQYAGAFQHFEDIPHRYRLETYATHYQGQNTWQTYVDEILLARHDSDRMRQTARLAGESWLNHMDARSRHHALASPDDVEAWCEQLLDELTRHYAYEHYFLRIYDFYEYLKRSFRHPHLYNPFLLAATEYENTRSIWMIRVERRISNTDE